MSTIDLVAQQSVAAHSVAGRSVAGRSVAEPSLPTTRLGWALSPAGRTAACKIPLPDGIVVEVREPFTASPRRLVTIPDLGLDSEVLLSDEGTVTAVTRASGQLRIRSWPTGDDPYDWPTVLGMQTRVLPHRDGTLYTMTPAADGGCALGRVTPHGRQELGHLEHRVLDVHPLDPTTLVCTIVAEGHWTRAVEFDTTTGAVSDFVNTSSTADDRVMAIHGDTVIASTTASGAPRLGWGSLRAGRLRFPTVGAAERGARLLGLARHGGLALVAEDRGMEVLLREVDLVRDTSVEVATVTGQVAGTARLCHGRWRVPLADLTHGATLVEIDRDGVLHHDDAPIAGAPAGEVVTIAGPGGPIEALVVGDLQSADRVVIALHGGPMAAWRATYDPLFAELVADGGAVVAPNVRGSIGYGRAHTLAIRDQWGGPDRDDVLTVAEWVRSRRPVGAIAPVVHGESYGAFLAVLCAATAPYGTWSGCVGVATFTSGRRIQELGSSASALVQRLGGATSPDLLGLAGDLTVPVLLMHGDCDDTVPVSESLRLAAAIRAAGGTVDLVRDPAADHDLLNSTSAHVHRRRIRDAVRAAGGRGPLRHQPSDETATKGGELRCRSMTSIWSRS